MSNSLSETSNHTNNTQTNISDVHGEFSHTDSSSANFTPSNSSPTTTASIQALNTITEEHSTLATDGDLEKQFNYTLEDDDDHLKLDDHEFATLITKRIDTFEKEILQS